MQEVLPLHVSTYPVDFVYRHLERFHGIAQHVSSNRLHQIKDKLGLSADYPLLFHKTGSVYDGMSRVWIGSLTQGGKTEGEG